MGQTGKEPSQSRRHFLSALLEAGLSAPRSWAQSRADAVMGIPAEARRKTAVSPPGSISHKHLNGHCDGCGLCVQHCPTHVLRAGVTEYGPDNIAHPVLDFAYGYCGHECNACGNICPKGAIMPIDSDARLSVQIGIAVLVKELCLNGSSDSICSICADSCPAWAIKMKEDYNLEMVEVDGTRRHRIFPTIEEALCIGCGLCEYRCPSSGAKAIHIEGLKEHRD